MASILNTLSDEKISAKHVTMSRDSLSWLMKRIRNIKNPYGESRLLVKDTHRVVKVRDTSKFLMGGMYFFFYDPKTKSDLPYYDSFPMVIPLKREADGFIGLNLHYLPLKYRINFMRKLMPFAITNDEDEIKRFRVTYQILDASSRYREFRPCIKKYLYKNIRSRIISVEPHEWDIALFLPLQQFKKEKQSVIWQESLDQIKV